MSESTIRPEVEAARRVRTRRLSIVLGLVAIGVYAAFIFTTFLHTKG